MPGQSFYTIDPLTDSRWDELVATHPNASIFHHSGWLKALAETYGFKPLVLTTSPHEKQLSNGIPFCEVRSWITGARLVSLPFSDHCEPLLESEKSASGLLEWMKSEGRRKKWRYIEVRPLHSDGTFCPALVPNQSFWIHTLSLEPPLARIFERLHDSSVRRRIRRAEREQLAYEKGCSEQLLEEFYRLLIVTRMRHRLPPQPRKWFRNILTFLHPFVEIRVARKGAEPIASMITLRHGNTVVYKYGCSDDRYHHLAGMPFLFWRLIEESKTEGAKQIDFGRTDKDNEGLTRFKDHFGTERRTLTYLQVRDKPHEVTRAKSYIAVTQRLFSVLPDRLSGALGALFYRHIA